jgi:hypothetical protein
MADETDTQSPILSISDLGAPVIYFDNAPTFGFNNGIANVTLDAVRFLTEGAKGVIVDRIVVAHLRMSISAAMHLRGALDGVILAAIPKPEGLAN